MLFFDKRKVYILVGGHLSEKLILFQDIPQGDVISHNSGGGITVNMTLSNRAGLSYIVGRQPTWKTTEMDLFRAFLT